MSNYHNRFHFDNVFADAPMTLDNFTVFQVGDLYCESDTAIDEHEQFYHEISLIESGDGIMYTNGIPAPVKKGDVYLTFKNDRHRIVSGQLNPLRYYYMAFDAKETTVYDVILRQLQNKRCAPDSRVLQIPELFPLMTSILGEFSDKKIYHAQMFESYLIQILISLHRYTKQDNVPISIYEKNKKYFVYNLVIYIEHNITSIESLGDLAKRFAFDYSYMAACFKGIIGCPLQTYVHQKKMEHAKILLLRNKKSVTETAELLHYSSVNYFSRAFKEYHNITPQQVKMLGKANL
jgi:AraC-like DNA-binding protein